MVTFSVSRQPDYTDLDLNFSKNRRNNDIASLNGLDAVKNSIKNLVCTNYYEIPFNPSKGSNVRKLLFDNVTPMTAIFLKDAIEQVITNYESRVTLFSVDVQPMPDDNRYQVNIVFRILNVNFPVTVAFFLERIR